MSDTFTSSADRKSTIGLDHYSKVFTAGQKEMKLQLWDTGGMERVASITSSYYKHSEAAILVFLYYDLIYRGNRNTLNTEQEHFKCYNMILS